MTGSSAARWWVLCLLCIAIAGNYYEYDAIAPLADFLRTQRGFTQSQIGMLNAVFSLPNIVLALVGGLLIDRYGPARVAIWTASTCFIGAVFTAVGFPYAVMVCGRLLFGVSEEALFIALLAGLAQWFYRGGTAFAMGLFLCLACVRRPLPSLRHAPRWSRPCSGVRSCCRAIGKDSVSPQ